MRQSTKTYTNIFHRGLSNSYCMCALIKNKAFNSQVRQTANTKTKCMSSVDQNEEEECVCGFVCVLSTSLH